MKIREGINLKCSCASQKCTYVNYPTETDIPGLQNWPTDFSAISGGRTGLWSSRTVKAVFKKIEPQMYFRQILTQEYSSDCNEIATFLFPPALLPCSVPPASSSPPCPPTHDARSSSQSQSHILLWKAESPASHEAPAEVNKTWHKILL